MIIIIKYIYSGLTSFKEKTNTLLLRTQGTSQTFGFLHTSSHRKLKLRFTYNVIKALIILQMNFLQFELESRDPSAMREEKKFSPFMSKIILKF